MILMMATTASSQTEAKWEEVFDSPVPQDGWLVFNNDGSPPTSRNAATFTYSSGISFENNGGAVAPQAGNYFWFSNFDGANFNGLIDEWLVSPRISGVESGDALTFYAGAFDAEYHDSLRVFVSTTDSLLASFTNLLDYFKLDGPPGVYHELTFDLSEFAGNDIFFAVNYYLEKGGENGLSSDAIWVDHFKIGPGVTGVAARPQPAAFVLQQNYPNPFNPSTQITFQIPVASDVALTVFNALGQLVAAPLDARNLHAGTHTLSFDAGSLPNGHYYYRLQAGEETISKKMIVLK